VSTIAEWLLSLGMTEYRRRFAEERIEMDILPELTDEDLERLGIPLGHRRRMMKAIRELGQPPPTVPRVAAAVSAAPLDSAERRQLTVVFCDLVGSTALSARLDPEDLRRIIGAYHRRCTELIERNGGFVAKYMGDGVLAYFGYPRAHEHDAERAVRAGLAVVAAAPQLDTKAGVVLQVRVGISTGLVVVGDLIGSGEAQERGVVGEAPNLAARLQSLAEPGAVVISASTRKLIGGLFEYRNLGTVAVKGFAENVPAWQALGASAVESRFEAIRTATTPLVGREEEIDLLIRRWEQAKRRDGQVVLISGEPGIGKSRIAQTVLERISTEPHNRLRYFCSPHHQDSALYPSITQLERAAGFRREDTDEQRLAKLEAVLVQATDGLGETVPLLADLLSIPIRDRYPPLNLTPLKRKEKTLRTQLAQVEGLAAQQPVLIMWEDVHWSDPTTRESLDLLIDRIPNLRVLLIITFRPEFTPPWIGRPAVTLLALNRLAPRQRAEMIAGVTGGKALPPGIAGQIVDRTDGVPLFIEELTKTVVESGIVTDAGDHYSVMGPVTPLAIPTTLHASLLARLDRLAPTREVAQIGAALGRSFSHELISAVAMMSQQKLDEALEQLASAELVFRHGTPPDAEYTFKHALVQDVAHGTLLRSRRQQLHARIVSILESQFPEIVRTQPTLLAQHCTEAGLIERAVEYHLKAGHQAIERSAMLEAEAQLGRGLNLLASLPEDTQRWERELDLQAALIVTLMQTQGYTARAVNEPLARARWLCDKLDQPPQFANILYIQTGYHIISGKLPLACENAKEHFELGKAWDDPVVKLMACHNSAGAWFCRGEFTAARKYAEQALELYDTTHSSRYTMISPQDPQLAALMRLSSALSCLGHLDQARLRRDEALVQARQRAHHHTLAVVLALAWDRDAGVLSEPSRLLERAEELQAHCAEHGFPFFSAIANVYRGSALSSVGSTDEGLALITKGLAAYRATGALLFVPNFLRLLAECYRSAGCPTEGLKHLDEAAGHIDATQVRYDEAEMYRCRGELLIAVGDPVAAEASFRQAIAVGRRQGAKLWELRTAISLARFWRDQDKHTEARELLTPIYGWFIEGFDTPVLQDAKLLLEQLNA
jgi:class 3 adenylate cyclase/predicted ATPase